MRRKLVFPRLERTVNIDKHRSAVLQDHQEKGHVSIFLERWKNRLQFESWSPDLYVGLDFCELQFKKIFGVCVYISLQLSVVKGQILLNHVCELLINKPHLK